MLALNRMALEFPISDIPVVRWREHPGFETSEGKELNRTAVHDYGDDPDDWYVSEVPVDVLKAAAVWGSRSMLKPKLERWDHYLPDVRKMVTLCREQPGVFIPPSWLKEHEAAAVGALLNLPTVVPVEDGIVIFDN